MSGLWDGLAARPSSPSQRRAIWAAERRRIARRWFDGDEDAADTVLDALPYSSIPGWVDVDQVMQAMAEHWRPRL